jgi:hypothetical protein
MDPRELLAPGLGAHARYAACGDRGTLGMFDVAPA